MAYSAIYELVELQPVQTVLPDRGTTAVGVCAIQIAEALNARSGGGEATENPRGV